MPNDPILYGPYKVLTLPSRLDTSTQADIGRVLHGDRWASREIRDINPETLVRVLRNTADLGEMFALGDRIYLDAHFLSIATDRVSTVAGAEWDVQPYTDSPRATRRTRTRKLRTALPRGSLEAYLEHLACGDQADGPFVFERWQFMMRRGPRVSYQVEFHATASRTSR
jgi:hypothetical protein